MKKIVNILILALFITSITSCELDFQPEAENTVLTDEAFNSIEDVELALIGTYSVFRSGGALGGVSNWIGSLMAEEIETTPANSTGFDISQILALNFNFQNTTVRGMWNELYLTINRANNVILEADNFATGAERDQFLGEALFIRAFCHFELIKYFAYPYEFGQVNEQPGVPLRVEASRSISSQPRATVQAVYDQIIEDLIDAQGLMTADVDGRATAMAARALLAKVYFQQGDYDNALIEANAVITQGGYMLNPGVSDLWQIDHSDESIFEFNSIVADDAGAAIVGTYSQDNQDPNYYASFEFGELATSDPNDTRAGWYNLRSASSGGEERYYVAKYDRNNQNGEPVINLPVIKLSDILLIRAESYAQDNQLNLAAADLQTVRRRAFNDPALTVTFGGQGDLIEQIREERRLEMAFEFSDRFHELKRTKQNIQGLPYNSCELLFKIPNSEVNGNPSIQQNDC
ncbi:MAG: RagB/SusD family nutrient uptake outer membrane protein [Fulvivirga sp.]|uniref:RagB/SusD family nutrient uptake outer membrane protein n=1 Tax=Fulvivirga sp. TaxID=1931237 RepID=UPI0032EE54AE